jgi:1-phosphofructokinase family hexose kinase
VLVITPNLCFDRTVRVERFEAGAVVRPYDAALTVGGKGVNVCRAVADLGGGAQLVGLVGVDDAARFDVLSRAEGLRLRSVPVPGSVRQATIILEDGGRASVLNERGPTVGADEADALFALIERELIDGELAEVSAASSRVVVCSGSLPPGLPTDFYGRVATLAREHGALSVVDGAREALLDALPSAPDLVTPNLHEAEGALGGRYDESSHDDAPVDEVQARAFLMADGLRERGAGRALVTAGAAGAAYTAEGERHWVAAPAVQVRNPIGAGDALVGGLTHALSQGRPWLEAVTWGVAVASAAVEHPDAGRLDPDRARQLAGGQVTVS